MRARFLRMASRRGLWLTWVLIGWVALSLPATRGETAPPAGLLAGFAVADLTPSRSVPLANDATPGIRRSAGVHDPIRARVAYFRQARTSVALVSVDLMAITGDLHEALAARVRDLQLSALVLVATQTRAGPGGYSDIPLWRPQLGAFDPALQRSLLDPIVASIRAAARQAKPVTVSLVETPARDLVQNERDPAGPTPETLAALVIRDGAGKVRGLLYHFAARPTLLRAGNRQLSAGWPGAASARLESAHAGATALFLGGAMQDVVPALPERLADAAAKDGFERARQYGTEVARRLLAAPQVGGRFKEGRLRPLTIRSGERRARTVMGRLLGRPAPAHASQAAVAIRSMSLVLGPIHMHTVPGEPTAALGARYESKAGTWLVSCAQDHLGCFMDPRAAAAGGRQAERCLFDRGGAADLALAISPPPTAPPAPAPRALRHDRIAHVVDGTTHGRLLGPEIRDLLDAALPALEARVLRQGGALMLASPAQQMGLAPEDLVLPMLAWAARRFERHIPAEYLDEMQSLARAARVPYDAILLENTFLTLAEQTDPTALLRLPVRCTNVVAGGDATSLGQLIHASTLDWGLEEILRDRTITLVMEPRRGHPFVSITWPGMVGVLRAMGAQGLSLTEESCAAPGDTRADGLPINLLLRKVVQYADTLDDGVDLLQRGPGTCGYKLTLASGPALDARVVEVSATRSEVRQPVDGLLYGCDPDAPEQAFVGPRAPEIPPNDRSSARRYPALRELLEPARGGLRRDLIASALSTTDGEILNSGTLLACLFEPQLLQFHVALHDDVEPAQGELHWQSHELLSLLSPDVRARYALPPRVETIGAFRVTPLKVPFAGIHVKQLEFPSPLPCGRAHCDQVKAQLWLPEDPLGVVIEIPAWKESTLAGHRLLAMALARKRIATLILPLPGQVGRVPVGLRPGRLTLSANLAQTRQSFVQGLADIKRVSLWLESEGFPPSRQAIAGVSLGGHAAAIAFGRYPDRFRAGVFMLAGAHVEDAFLNENPITGRIYARLKARGVTAEEARPYISALEPLGTARPGRRDDVLLIAADADEVVPPRNAKALAAAYGGARIHWMKGGHYAILSRLGDVIEQMAQHLTTRFQAR